MILLLSGLLLLRQHVSSAAPIALSSPELSVYHTSLFIRDNTTVAGSGRTVWDIIWSCLATTFAVTWVSVHPNVPWLEEDKWSILRRRTFLMCLALLAPEVMIIWAFKQWRGATMIMETINKAQPSSCMPWTMTHAHWLQMGGLKLICTKEEAYNGNIFTRGNGRSLWKALDRDYAYQSRLIPDGTVWEGVLHFNKLKGLLQDRTIEFPKISEEEIDDHSKGDALTKGVAFLQIIWFIIQLIARGQQRLAITEIELTTAALAGLNSVMYLCWWSKPQDARFPIIGTNAVEGILRNGGDEVGSWSFNVNDAEDAQKSTWQTAHINVVRVPRQILDAFYSFISIIWMIPSFTKRIVCSFTSSVQPNCERQPLTVRRAIGTIWLSFKSLVINMLYLPYLLMFMPANKILDPRSWVNLETMFSDPREKIHSKPNSKLLLSKADMEWIMSMIFYSENVECLKTKPLLCISALAGAVFGLIHFIAWHINFPSQVEKILWRMASLAIIAVCLLVVMGMPLYDIISRRRNMALIRYPRAVERKYWNLAQMVLETAPAILYPISRMLLLFLALLSLRNLPQSALETVTWTTFIPHI